MNAGDISIQLTIIEENARAARLAIVQAMVLRPQVEGKGAAPILGPSGQALNQQQVAMAQAFEHHNEASMRHINTVLGQAAHLQQTIAAATAPEPSKLKLAGEGP